MKQLSELLPNSRLYNTYGGTEIGCVSTYQFNDGKYMEGCIGHTMPNADLQIAEDGSLVVSGKTIMSGYVGDERRTAEILHEGKIYMADLGYRDEQGFIHLTGRRDDIINIGGFKVAPTEIEDAAMESKLIEDCICIPVRHGITGCALKLLVVMAEGRKLDKKTLAMYLKTRLEAYKVPLFYEQVNKINRTYNGKIDRKSYKHLFD